jgi:glutathione S-transferase
MKMALTFYYGSGSPFAWKVWLTLEHKGIAHEAKRLSFDKEETRSPEFLKVNPRAQVPAILDDGFALAQSNAICEYLEERYPDKPLMPKDVKARAIIRRMIAEADDKLYKASSELMDLALYAAKEPDLKAIGEAKAKLLEEMKVWEGYLNGDYFGGALSLADFAIYPYMRMPVRVEERAPGLGLKRTELPPKVAAWLARIEAMPYYAKTIPPHWKA